MSKKRISKSEVTAIGEERISILTKMSIDALADGREDLAVRYVSLARKIGMKTKAKMPSNFKYCKECHIPLVPGVNCSIRLTQKKIVTTCHRCGGLIRMPYLKERSK